MLGVPNFDVLYVSDQAGTPSVCALLRELGFRVHALHVEQVDQADLSSTRADLLAIDLLRPFADCELAVEKLKATVAGVNGSTVWLCDATSAEDPQIPTVDTVLLRSAGPRQVANQVELLLRSRRAEQAALRLTSEWQVTFDAIAEAVLVITAYGEVVRCNAAALRMLGRPRSEVLGIHYADLWGDPSPLPAGLPDLGLLDAPFVAEVFIRDRAYRISAEPVGESLVSSDIETVIVLTDITELRNYDTELRNYADALELRHGRQAEFLQLLSHELRNPLAAITAAIDALDAREDPDTTAPQRMNSPVAVIQRQAENLRHIVSDLLNLNRIAAGEFTLSKQVIDIREPVRAALAALAHRLEAASLAVTCRLGDAPLLANADRTRVEQVLVNILDNAIKYTPDGGSVVVELTATGGGGQEMLELSVLDTGLGMTGARASAVFEMFVHYDSTLKRAQGGLGVGLAFVRRVVEMHDGTVSAESDGPGRGTRFVVRIPRVVPISDQRSEPDGSLSSQRSPVTSGTILLVEDNEDLRLLTASALRKTGYQVFEASNGADGERVALAQRPAAIVMDIGLPDMDGFELASRLRASGRLEGTRLIAVTGFGTPEAKQRAFDSGFDAHFVKPLRVRALLDALRDDEPVGEKATNP